MVKELSTYFVGRGEVKGIEFTQIHKTDYAYMYECVNNGQIHYEVFKRKENKHFNTVSYPSSKAFGLWAWTFANILDAQAKLELINKPNEAV